jgi:hypothetical protein
MSTCVCIIFTRICSQLASQQVTSQEVSSSKAHTKPKAKGRKKRAADNDEAGDDGNDAESEDSRDRGASTSANTERRQLMELIPGLLAVMAASMHSLRPQVINLFAFSFLLFVCLWMKNTYVKRGDHRRELSAPTKDVSESIHMGRPTNLVFECIKMCVCIYIHIYIYIYIYILEFGCV